MAQALSALSRMGPCLEDGPTVLLVGEKRVPVQAARTGDTLTLTIGRVWKRRVTLPAASLAAPEDFKGR